MHFTLTWRSRTPWSLLALTALLWRSRTPWSLLALTTVLTATTTGLTGTAAAVTRASSTGPACAAPASHAAQAASLAHAIDKALHGRFTSADPSYNPFEDVSVAVQDAATGLRCWYHPSQQNYSASAVKATILAALLLKVQDEHRALTPTEKSEAWLMITESDNNAASALWADVGLTSLQHFLDEAKMKQTALNTWGAWGLTQITGHDETLLLRLLMAKGNVLSTTSRQYELSLMNHVESSETWGVRAGSPKYYTWHIKNGWSPLPDPSSSPWVINSIGCFLHTSASSHRTSGYTIVVLTHDNPSESYGIGTVESIAWVINRALVPGAVSVWPKSGATASTPEPDEAMPARPAGH